jgi:hypothetical protein
VLPQSPCIHVHIHVREMYKPFEDISENTNMKQQYQN